MNYNLDVKFIMCSVYYFISSLFNYSYLLFQISSSHNSVTVQRLAHVYINFFITKTCESVYNDIQHLQITLCNAQQYVCECPSRIILLLLYDRKWSFRNFVKMDCVFEGAVVCPECCMTDHKQESINCISFIPLRTVQSY